jgi:hypothetical protein
MQSVKLVSKLILVLGLVILLINLFGCCPCMINKDKAAVSNATICKHNLKNINLAKEQWALENKKSADAVPTWNDLLGSVTPSAPYLSGMPKCPDGGTYTLNAVSKNPTCSIPGHTID